MNRLAFRIPRALENVFEHARFSRNRFQNGLAVAVSGGADSMALACLAKHHFQHDDHPHTKVVAFIVDHGLRDGSASEAQTVKQYVENKIGIQAEVLSANLRKSMQESGRSDIETLAREVRFRLLGDACLNHHIQHLLCGHHIVDDYETIIMRRATRAGVMSLSLKQEQAMPVSTAEARQTYGFRHSGLPTDVVSQLAYGGIQGYEAGGLCLLRPLLRHTKQDLVHLLQENKLWWVEDPSNADVSLTLRNAVRSLEQSKLPKALQQAYVLSQADTAKATYEKYFECAKRCFDRCQLKFDPILGRLYARLPSWKGIQWECLHDGLKSPRLVIAFLLRLLADIVDRSDLTSLQDFQRFVGPLYPQSKGGETSRFSFKSRPNFNWSTPTVRIRPFELKDGLPWPPRSSNASHLSHTSYYLMLERTQVRTSQVDSPELNLAIVQNNAKLHMLGKDSETTSSTGLVPQSIVDAEPNAAVVPVSAEALSVKSRGQTAPIHYFFDYRYWISINNPTLHGLVMRRATMRDFKLLQDEIDERKVELLMDKSLADCIRGPTRNEINIRRLLGLSPGMRVTAVVPVLVALHRDGSSSKQVVMHEKLLGFPTLGVRVRRQGQAFDRVSWTVRYKACNFYGHHLQDIELAQARPETRHQWHHVLTSPETRLSRSGRDALEQLQPTEQIINRLRNRLKGVAASADKIKVLSAQLRHGEFVKHQDRVVQREKAERLRLTLERDEGMRLLWSGALPEAETPVWSHWAKVTRDGHTPARYDELGFDGDPNHRTRKQPYVAYDDEQLHPAKAWTNFHEYLWKDWQPRVDDSIESSDEEFATTSSYVQHSSLETDELLLKLNDIVGLEPEPAATGPTLYKHAADLRNLAAQNAGRKLKAQLKKQQAIADKIAQWAQEKRERSALIHKMLERKRGVSDAAPDDMEALMDTVFASIKESREAPKTSSWNKPDPLAEFVPDKQHGKDSFAALLDLANSTVAALDHESIVEEADDVLSEIRHKGGRVSPALKAVPSRPPREPAFDLEDLNSTLANVDFHKASKPDSSQDKRP